MPSEFRESIKELGTRAFIAHSVLLTKVKEAGGEDHLRGNLKAHFKSFEIVLGQVFAYVKRETGNDASVIGGLANFVVAGGKLKDIDEYHEKMDVEFRSLMKEIRIYEDASTLALMMPDPINYPKMATHSGTYDIYNRVKELSARCKAIVLNMDERIKNPISKQHEKFDMILAGFQELIPEIAAFLQKVSGEREGTIGRFKHVVLSDSYKEDLEEYNMKLSRWSDLWNLEVSNLAPMTYVGQAATAVTDAVTGVTGLVTGVVGGLAGVATSAVAAVTGSHPEVHKGKTKVSVAGLQGAFDYFSALGDPDTQAVVAKAH